MVKFREDPTIRVALLSVTAAGVGLDFSTASAVVFAELPSEISYIRQAEDRAHRQGQRNTVNVYFLCARGTSDERLWQRLSTSLARLDAVHDGVLNGSSKGLIVDKVTSLTQAAEMECNVGMDRGEEGMEGRNVLEAVIEELDLGVDVVCDLKTLLTSWWFEVSPFTNRVHFHAAQDGSRPLRLSLPMEALLFDGAPMIRNLLDVVNQMHFRADKIQELGSGQVIGGIGPLHLNIDSMVTSIDHLKSAIACAKAFSREWMELPNFLRSRLTGKLLQIPLDDDVAQAKVAAIKNGAFGTSKDRYRDANTDKRKEKLPPGAVWKDVVVHYDKFKKRVTYCQGVVYDEDKVVERLCIHCFNPVPGAEAMAIDELLSSSSSLFCKSECERRYAVARSGTAVRKGVFWRDRGICAICELDCDTLVRRLRAIERGTENWHDRRRKLLQTAYPDFVARTGQKTIDALIMSATAGTCWQADHIIPVYMGGGQCDLDNLRTLCAACHRKVTSEQSKERAVARRLAKRTMENRALSTADDKTDEGPTQGNELKKMRQKRGKTVAERGVDEETT